MRCKNCGWPNKPNETVCVKCGSPLESESPMSDYGNNYESPVVDNRQQDGDGLKKTVLESEPLGGDLRYNSMEHESQPTVGETTCPKCNYPLRANAVKCPNCNFAVNGNQDTRPLNANTNGYQRRPTRMAEAPEETQEAAPRVIPKTGKFRGTINPYMMNIPEAPSFVLKPLQRMNERKPVESVELELEGGEVVLTRDNTEPGNPSITSKAQAVVSNSDGHWYIENCSEQKTTFVLAYNKIELHDGDIILLGNRMFEFKEQK